VRYRLNRLLSYRSSLYKVLVGILGGLGRAQTRPYRI
jgi:hypothetical protein